MRERPAERNKKSTGREDQKTELKKETERKMRERERVVCVSFCLCLLDSKLLL